MSPKGSYTQTSSELRYDSSWAACRNLEGRRMNRTDEPFDWASSALYLVECPSTSLSEIVRAARLDPIKGDVSHIDLSSYDLRGENLSGWDLSHACFRNALVAGANLTTAKLDLAALLEANDWGLAKLSIIDRRTMNAMLHDNMHSSLIAAGFRTAITNLETFIVRSRAQVNRDFSRRHLSQILLNRLLRRENKYDKLVKSLKKQELHFLHNVVFALESIIIDSDENYIIDIIDSIYKLSASRPHTFYDTNNDTNQHQFHAFYCENNTVIDIVDSDIVRDKPYSEWLKGLGLRAVSIPKSLFGPIANGRIKRNKETDIISIKRLLVE